MGLLDFLNPSGGAGVFGLGGLAPAQPAQSLLSTFYDPQAAQKAKMKGLLTGAGISLLSQQPSTMPITFGSQLGGALASGATAGQQASDDYMKNALMANQLNRQAVDDQWQTQDRAHTQQGWDRDAKTQSAFDQYVATLPQDQQTMWRMDPKGAADAYFKSKYGAGGTTKFGVTPQYGVDAQGNSVLLQLGENGTVTQPKLPDGVSLSNKNPVKLDAGTNWIILDPVTRQQVAVIPKNNEEAAQQTAHGTALGKGTGEAAVTFQSMTSKMPGLESVVGELDKLSNDATYTTAGQALDYGRAELGMQPRDAAVARTKYTAMVNNQILPMLRDTFGAQFTEREGKTLEDTMGDPNKTPTEKQAVLKAFIEQKRRDIQALALQQTIAAQNQGGAPASAGVSPRGQPGSQSIDDLVKKYGG